MIAAVWAFLLAVATGYLVMRVLLPAHPALLSLAFGTGIGVGLLTLVSFVSLLLGDRPVSVFADVGLIVCLLGIWGARGRRGTRAAPVAGTDRGVVPSRRIPLLGVAALAAAALALTWFVLFTAGRPHGDWDAWAIWNLRARFFVRGGSFWADAFDPAMLWSHPDYPLLLPLAVARLWGYAGAEPTAAPALIAGGFTGATAAMLYGLLSFRVSRSQAMIATTVLFGVPYFVKVGAAQQADIPVGFFCLAASGAAILAGRGRPGERGWVVLAGLCAALAGWTKNEGLVLLVTLGGLIAAGRIVPSGYRVRALSLFAAGAAPVMVAVAFFKLALAPSGYLLADPGALLGAMLDPGRYLLIGSAYGREFLTLGMGLPLAVGALLLGRTEDRTRRREAGTVLLILALLVASHMAVYVITPYDLEWQLGTSLNRLLIQLWPTAVCAVFLLVRQPAEFPA